MNGGYIMIDCKKLNLLSQSSQTISGLYEACKAAYSTGKPILAGNAEYGEGVPLTPIPVFGILEAGVYILTASILQVRIASDDSVTITNLIQMASEAKTTTRKG